MARALLAFRALGWLARSWCYGVTIWAGMDSDHRRYSWGAAEGIARALWLRATRR